MEHTSELLHVSFYFSRSEDTIVLVDEIICSRVFGFLAFDFCRFCVVIRGFHPRHNSQWPPTSNDFLYQILSITFIFLS